MNQLESFQRRAARFACKDFRKQSHVSDMLRDINWKTLEDRRTIARLISQFIALKLAALIIIIIVISKCYFFGEHIALSHTQKTTTV